MIQPYKDMLRQAETDLAAARAEIERLTLAIRNLTAPEAVAVMRQWPDPLTSDMARALEQHRESLLVEIMSMFDKMQRELDYSRGGKLGPVDPPQPSASVVEAIAACETVLICAQEMCKAGHPVSAFNVATDALRALKGDK